MRIHHSMASAALVPAAIVAAFGAAFSAQATTDTDALELNGRYQATSDGQWAQTNDQFHNQATVTAIWTITSNCVNPMECTGQVSSDQGWTAPLQLVGGNMWRVVHDVPNWEQCNNGLPAAPGHQIFRFSADEQLTGDDHTVGPSGACGVNKWLVIDLPFKLVKIG
jgi:hypothetical protein